MSIDVSQFHQVFFEESAEGLDIMESALMELDVNAPDLEVINTIFRSAHSIKGGAGTFGFQPVSTFTHDVETLLDQIRSGEEELTKEDVDLFLQSVDCLRDIFASLQENADPDMEQANGLSERFAERLNSTAGSDQETKNNKENEAVETGKKSWKIFFKPDHDILKAGNEPVRLFSELAALGEFSCQSILDRLPPIDEFHPDECYMSWNISLLSDCSEQDIEEVFEWVIDDAELTVTLEESGHQSNKTAQDEASTSQTPIEDPTEEPAAAQKQKDKPAPVQTKQKAGSAPSVEQTSIRVGIDKVDSLINMVGELVITQSMLGQLGERFDMTKLVKLQEGLSQLEQNTRELQESVMRIRMLPISFSFSRFPRVVRDLSQKLGKKINLVLEGEQTELDKTVMEKIGDPLVHLVRNSIDHGIELPEERVAKGKPEEGTLKLNAFHQGGNVIIEISDDGAGLSREKILGKAMEKGLLNERDQLSNEQIWQLIFHPGFSTAKEVSDVSGRGVGMDVVKRNIEALNGTVEIRSEEGKGSTVSICLPLTLAILDGQLVNIGEEIYIFPLVSIVESLQIDESQVNSVANGCDVLRLRDDYIPIIKLHEVLSIKANYTSYDEGLLVVVEANGEKVGILVDDLDAQQQIVIKSLEQNYKRVLGVSGATILGNGTVALILDVAGLIKISGELHSKAHAGFTLNNTTGEPCGLLN